MILAGDIGGTKARLALFAPGAPPRSPAFDERLPTHGSPSLEAILQQFLARSEGRPDRVVLGIAGPVSGNRCVTTNLPWQVDGEALARTLGSPVTLLNDLEATAWGLETLGEPDLVTLQPGERAAGNRALIAAGTGLGEAILMWDGAGWHPMASEGGHADFAARDELEDELLRWLRGKYGRVSYERVLSGPGLADLYRFFRATRRGTEPDAVAMRFDHADQPAAIVTETALDGSCERARLTLERFVSIYGAEAGNLALKAMALAGVYVGGGIAPRILAALTRGGFARAFFDKGRLSPLLTRIPVRVVLDEGTALWGAAAFAMRAAT
ncbi:MAG TPA: glucokinase [Candidatus Acidoferrales bacterium]|nr:glucokinase [Candidatus Acidoferrales bacterium]